MLYFLQDPPAANIPPDGKKVSAEAITESSITTSSRPVISTPTPILSNQSSSQNIHEVSTGEIWQYIT